MLISRLPARRGREGTVRIGVDATSLLLCSAGIKTWTWHWLRHLQINADGDEIVPFPSVPRSVPLIHNRSALDPWATYRRLALLYAVNSPGSPLLGCMTRRFDAFHITSQIRNVPRHTRITGTLHDMTCWIMPQVHTQANVGAELDFVDLLVRRSPGILAVSNNTKNDAVRLLKINPDRIQVIYPGVADDFFDADPLHRPKRYVLYVGTIEPRKNIVTLLDAWKKVRPSLREEFDLLLAGAVGWKSEDILARLQSGVSGVEYLGYVPQHRLPELMAGATAFVYPSLYEGFGFPVVEAMAARVPVVTSNNSSLAEVADSAAVLVDPESPQDICDSLEGLLTSPASRARYSQAGWARAKTFSWKESACRAIEFFRGLD